MLRIAMLSYHTCPLAILGGKDTGGMNVYVRDLSRELGRGFAVRARYAVFRNAASDLNGGYARHTVFAGASWEMR